PGDNAEIIGTTARQACFGTVLFRRLLVVGGAGACAGRAHPADAPLGGREGGPYRGRMIDLESGPNRRFDGAKTMIISLGSQSHSEIWSQSLFQRLSPPPLRLPPSLRSTPAPLLATTHPR